jgi:multiple sugar transport system substrate-binding protein
MPVRSATLRSAIPRSTARRSAAFCLSLALVGCGPVPELGPPTLRWYVFHEPSGAFAEAARRCSEEAAGRYRVELSLLPADADQQREQLVRRLAAGDPDLDLIGMDVIWTAELAEAGWILPWPEDLARRVTEGRIAGPVASATYQGRLWGAPFTTNTQLLWYRSDRVDPVPETWDALIDAAERLGQGGRIQVQGERYEGLTVLFVSLLASAGGSVLDPGGRRVALQPAPTRKALRLMRRLAASPAADPALASSREDQNRLAFESGGSTFMVNYTYVWPSARANAPQVANHMGWARWPALAQGYPSRVTIGGINLGVSAHARHPGLAFEAAACIASESNQRLAARLGGLPPTTAALYEDPEVRRTFPFADILRATLEDAVQRPQSPLYSDISIAIARTLHPMSAIDPDRDARRLREAVGRALRSEGLL